MGAYLAASVYAIAAIAAAYVISPEKSGIYRWIFVGWLAFIVPNFVFPSPLIGLATAAIILLLLPKKTKIERVVLYTGIFCAMQPAVNYMVPFPGINFLIQLDFAQVSFLVLLLPILLAGRPRGERGADQSVAVCLIAFMALTAALGIRDLPFTSALRNGVSTMLLLLPVLAISWSIRTKEDFTAVLKALVILGLIFSTAGIVSQLVRWNFYAPFSWHDFRWGMVRVGGTTYPVLAGMFALIALIIATFGLQQHLPRSQRLIIQGVLFSLVLFSFTRGVWISGAAALIVYWLLITRASNASVMLMGATGAVGGLVLGTSVLQDFDPYGTFAYRAELLIAAQKQFWTAPFFGSPNYLESGNFDHLVTGFQIIDVVNYYVQVTMEYGLVGMALYLAPFLIVMLGLLRLRAPRPRRHDQQRIEINQMVALCCALISAHLVLIMTVSGVELILHFGYLLLGLSMGAIKVAASATAAVRGASLPESANQTAEALSLRRT